MEVAAYAITNATPEVRKTYQDNSVFKLTVIHHANIRIEVYLPKKTKTEMFHVIDINVHPKPHVKEHIFTYDEIDFIQMKTQENDSEEYINQWKDFIRIYLRHLMINNQLTGHVKLNDREEYYDPDLGNDYERHYTDWLKSDDIDKLDLNQLIIKDEDEIEFQNYDEYIKFYRLGF